MIKKLPTNVINKIAAGEVVERPASIVKELLENSIDAGAKSIKLVVNEYGIKNLTVIDDGIGIKKDDIDKVFLSHATSKIKDFNDLNNLYSFGFRGEALASISSVSQVVLETKHKTDELGTYVECTVGSFDEMKPVAMNTGTKIAVKNLFYNVPTRRKFLKSRSTENHNIVDIFNRFLVAYPEVKFDLEIDTVKKEYLPSNYIDRISKLFKVQTQDLIPLFYHAKDFKLSGYIISPSVEIKSNKSQLIYVNHRIVSDSIIAKAIKDGYGDFLMKGKYPGYVIFLNIRPDLLDVNIHPRKLEVKFINSRDIYLGVKTTVNSTLIKKLKQKTLEIFSNNQSTEQKPDVHDQNPEVGEKHQERKKESYDNDFESFLNEGREKEYSGKNTEQNNNLLNKKNVDLAIDFSKEVIKQEREDDKVNDQIFDYENISQFWKAYIFVEKKESILFIDQHAASERIYYEYFLKKINDGGLSTREVLFPEVLSLSESEVSVLLEQEKYLREFGIKFELFGQSDIKITTIPHTEYNIDVNSFVREFIQKILEDPNTVSIGEEFYGSVAASLACHTAIRFGQRLTSKEQIQLIHDLLSCKDPYNCPHGRPIINEIGKNDLKKMFKR